MRVLFSCLLLSTACGRVGFDAQNVTVDAQDGTVDAQDIVPVTELLDLCPGDPGLDLDADQIPDGCDPCLPTDDSSCSQPHGINMGALPSWQERAFLLVVNLIRADPQGFRDRHMTFTDTTGDSVFGTAPPAVPPFTVKQLAQEGAHFHAQDIGSCVDPGADSALCDGTPWGTWKTPYDPLASAAFYPHQWESKGPEEAFYIAGAFACGWANSSTTSRTYRNCAEDNNAIRRQLYFNTTYVSVGTGYGNSDTSSFWSILFSNEAPAFDFPIVTGGNFFWDQNITFGFNLETQQPIKQAYVVLDGVREVMNLHLGTASRGFYSYITTPTPTCRSYYFVVVDANDALWRYPTEGALRSGGEGDCTEVWAP